jgi:hypothetical protein
LKYKNVQNTIQNIVSETIGLVILVVPFRETIVEPPETDMVNEELSEENKLVSTEKQVNDQKPLIEIP